MTPKERYKVWADRWRTLRAWGRPLEEVTVEVRERSAAVGDYSTGRAHTVRRHAIITVAGDVADSLATILHEFAHMAVPGDDKHSARWATVFAAAATEVTGIRVMSDVDANHLDRLVTDAVATWWKASGNEFIWTLLGKK